MVRICPAKLNTLFEIHTNMARLSTTSNRMEPIHTTALQLVEGGGIKWYQGFGPLWEEPSPSWKKLSFNGAYRNCQN